MPRKLTAGVTDFSDQTKLRGKRRSLITLTHYLFQNKTLLRLVSVILVNIIFIALMLNITKLLAKRRTWVESMNMTNSARLHIASSTVRDNQH